MNTPARASAARPSIYASLTASFNRAVVWIARCHGRYTQRRQLAELDDYRLRDIGVTHADARREAQKPFWRA